MQSFHDVVFDSWTLITVLLNKKKWKSASEGFTDNRVHDTFNTHVRHIKTLVEKTRDT